MDLMSHKAGHLWSTLFGLKGDPYFGVLHLLRTMVITAGLLLFGGAWLALHAAQRRGRLATPGRPYSYVQYPQYIGLIVIMVGFVLQWPTLLTLLMFPFFVDMYVPLARTEEADVRRSLGAAYDSYAAVTPAWFPRWGGPLSPGRPATDMP